MKNLTRISRSAVLITAISMTACTWVKPTDEAINVRVLYHNQVEHCQQIGRTTVSVLDAIAFIHPEDQVTEELETLARNSAAEIHGDSVVAISKVIDGEQVYNIYQCKNQ